MSSIAKKLLNKEISASFYYISEDGDYRLCVDFADPAIETNGNFFTLKYQTWDYDIHDWVEEKDTTGIATNGLWIKGEEFCDFMKVVDNYIQLMNETDG